MKQYIVNVDETTNQIVGQGIPYEEVQAQTQAEDTGFAWGHLFGWGGSVIGLLILILCSIVLVKQQTVSVIERFGKFIRTAKSGISLKIPFIDSVIGEVDLRIQQLDVEVETKTQDNVFVLLNVSVQYFINPDEVYNAFYKLEQPKKQIASYVFDVVRSEVPKMKLDDVFEKKEQIALAVKKELAETMNGFGFNILQALITDINPDEKVKVAMNEINAQQRLRLAANEKGEAEKILVVKKAEAEAESKKLQGKGIADQRKAIIDGLKISVEDFQKAVKGTEAQDVMNLVLLTQYFDTIKDVGTSNNTHTIMLPHSPNGLEEIKNQLNLMIAKR